ncbi:MAG TPA: hypothetical protein VGB95_02980 [Chitinophagales bacterium]
MNWRFRVRRHLVFLRQFFWEAFREKLLVGLVITIFFGLIIALLNHVFYGTTIWNKFAIEPNIETEFCEVPDMKNLIRQPFNTFTNFIYLINGLYFFSKGLEDIKKKRSYNLITANRFYSFTLAGIMLYIFLCSSFFHSSLVDIASDMDFSGVYSIALFPLMYFTHRVSLVVRGLPSNVKYKKERLALIIVFSLLYLLLTVVISIHLVHRIVGTFIFFIFVFGFYIERKARGQTNRRYLFEAIITLVLAIMFFEFDFAKIMCEPEFYIFPHNYWHLFNGLSMFFFYLYIRSESYHPEHDKLRLVFRDKAHQFVEKKYIGVTKTQETDA